MKLLLAIAAAIILSGCAQLRDVGADLSVTHKPSGVTITAGYQK